MALPPLYDPEAVRPMWEELVAVGVTAVHTPEEVREVLSRPEGTALVFVNSVCGCAAGSARPGLAQSLQNAVIPDAIITVFAGVDREAVDVARSFMVGVPPSSPCVALFKDGKIVHMIERRHIEMMNIDILSRNLAEAFNKYCTRQGPSVSPEVFAKTEISVKCGSSVPRYKG